MARTANESPFMKRIIIVGIDRLLRDTEILLQKELTETQRITNEEMRSRLLDLKKKYTEEAK